MKDKLEDFIIDNREEFDLIEPSDKLWAGIQSNLEKEKKFKINWKKIVYNSAAVILIFFTSYSVLEYVHYKKDPIGNDFGIAGKKNEIPQLNEAEAYYTHKVNFKMQEVSKLLEEHPDVAEELKNDLSQIDSMNADLKSDLRDNVANQEVVEVLIQNYRIKLEILESLLNELNELNDYENTNKYEL